MYTVLDPAPAFKIKILDIIKNVIVKITIKNLLNSTDLLVAFPSHSKVVLIPIIAPQLKPYDIKKMCAGI
jgi:hypothetical protein